MSKLCFLCFGRSLGGKNKTTGAFSPVYKYLQTNIFSQRRWIVFAVSIKLAREFFCCLTFQKWYILSKTMLERVQAVCKLLRDTRIVLAVCLLLDFPENQWLETGTKFLASVQHVLSDNLKLFQENCLHRLFHGPSTSVKVKNSSCHSQVMASSRLINVLRILSKFSIFHVEVLLTC